MRKNFVLTSIKIQLTMGSQQVRVRHVTNGMKRESGALFLKE